MDPGSTYDCPNGHQENKGMNKNMIIISYKNYLAKQR